MKKVLFTAALFMIMPIILTAGVEKNVSIHTGLSVSISFDLKSPIPFYTQLLTVRNHSAIFTTFFIEQIDEDTFDLLHLSPNSFERYILECKKEGLDSLYNIKLSFFKHENRCSLTTSCDTIEFANIVLPVSNFQLVSFPLDDTVEVKYFEVLETEFEDKQFSELKWILLFILFDIILFSIIYLKNKNKNTIEKSKSVIIKHRKYLKSSNKKNSSISLFGKLKVINTDGDDISYKFSPILKEILFLLICYSKENGISSERIKELLWFDKSPHSAINNRSVYFNKLRNIMKDVGDFKLTTNNGFWKIETSNITIDYLIFCDIINKNSISKDDVIILLGILEHGKFLGDFEENWADGIKSEISDSIILLLSNYLVGFNLKSEPDFVIQICDVIFNFDSLNEIALNYKCMAYKEKGNHTLAKLTYSNYIKDYQALYGEEYSRSFSDIIYLQ